MPPEQGGADAAAMMSTGEMIMQLLQAHACRTQIAMLTATVAAAVLQTPAPARAYDLFCVQRGGEIGFWLGEASPLDSVVIHGDTGRAHFYFDTATGDFLEKRVGSRAAITDIGRYEIIHDERAQGRDILAISANTTLHVRVGVGRTAFLRVLRGAVIEIGTCEPVTE